MAEIVTIEFTKGWQPDWHPGDAPEGSLTECKNLLPEDDYLKPVHGKVNYSTGAVTGTPLFAYETRGTDGVYYPFVFTSSNIYRMATATGILTELTRTASDYAAVTNNWSVTPYGDWLVATDYNDVVQVIKDVGGSTEFVALGGTPPKAKFCLFYSGYLILANLLVDSTASPKKVQWSALESIEDWTASLTTGSDSQDLADADGDITGMVPCGSGVAIFHENSITYSQFIGAPYTFSFKSNVVSGIGALPGTMINVNGMVYFMGRKGIYIFDGTQVVSIGTGVRRMVIDNMDYALAYRNTVTFDKAKGIIKWSYVSTESSGTPDKILCYNINNKRFTHVDVAHNCIFNFRSAGYTDLNGGVDDATSAGLSALYGGILDNFPDDYSFDSNYWQAGYYYDALLDTTGYVATFSGTALTGVIETAERRISDKELYVSRVRPNIINKTNVTVQLLTRTGENDTKQESAITSIGSNDYADVRQTGRFASVRLTLGDHDGIMSCDVYGIQRGNR